MKIKRPSVFGILFFYVLIVSLLVFYCMYKLSLSFFGFFSLEVVFVLAIPMLFFLLLSFFAANKYKRRLKQFSIINFLLLFALVTSFPNIKSYIITDTEKKGINIANAVSSYKTSFGKLPSSLDELSSDSISKTAIVKRPFHYQKIDDFSFVISIVSFDGMRASYYSGSARWNYND